MGSISHHIMPLVVHSLGGGHTHTHARKYAYRKQPSVSTTTLQEGIVGVDGTSNQAMIQQSSRTLPGVHLNFQMPGFVLQDRTIIIG